jgi:hypothetical protein
MLLEIQVKHLSLQLQSLFTASYSIVKSLFEVEKLKTKKVRSYLMNHEKKNQISTKM